MKTILIKNVFFKFLFPLYLLISSKQNLPELWAERKEEYLKFVMIKQNYTPREVQLPNSYIQDSQVVKKDTI